PAGGAGTPAGAETCDRGLRRTCGDEGDARRGLVGAVPGAWRSAGSLTHDRGNAPHRPCGKSGTGGARSLQSSSGTIEIWRLERLRNAVRCNARAFGENEPATHGPLASRIRILAPRMCAYAEGHSQVY